MADHVTHVTREELIRDYVDKIRNIEGKTGKDIDRKELLDIVGEVVQAIEGKRTFPR